MTRRKPPVYGAVDAFRHEGADLVVGEYGALMRHRPASVLRPPEYPRPVIPTDLTEDQQDELLDQMMDALLRGRWDLRGATRPDVEVRKVYGGDWSLDEDVVEF